MQIFLFFPHWCQQRKHRRVYALVKTRLNLRCFKMRQISIFQIFFLLMRAAKAQASLCIGKNSLSVRCFKLRQLPNSRFFVSRSTHAAIAQVWLCIGISSTDPSLLENAITVHCEIFQIKHRNFNKRVITTYFLKNKHTIRTPIQGLHCLLRYKD